MNKDSKTNTDSTALSGIYQALISEASDELKESSKSIKNDLSDEQVKTSAKKAKGFEYGTSDEVVKDRKNKLIVEIADDIQKEQKEKSEMKSKLVIYMTRYFTAVSIVVGAIVISQCYSDELKEILLGGFFANLIGLFVIIFKYVFSPSRELLDFWEKITIKEKEEKNKN